MKACIIKYIIYIAAQSMLFLPPLQAGKAPEKSPHLLNVIVFDSNKVQPPEVDMVHDLFDMPSNQFPVVYSQLFYPEVKPIPLEAPKGLIPKEQRFLDTYTFEVTKKQIEKKKYLSHGNSIVDIDYKIRFLFWQTDGYKVELEGKYKGLKFKDISVFASVDKTKIIRIRYSSGNTVFFALTSANEIFNLSKKKPGNGSRDEKESKPRILKSKLLEKKSPVYPVELENARLEGKVQIKVFINTAGETDPHKFFLLQCPHYLFARSSLDAFFTGWRYSPAILDGKPIPVIATVTFNFVIGVR